MFVYYLGDFEGENKKRIYSYKKYPQKSLLMNSKRIL